MYERLPELVNAVRQRLAFWELRPEQNTVFLANTNSYKPIIEAFYAAAVSLGSRPTLITIPHQYPFQDIPPFAEEALCQADFLVDLQHLTWGYTRSHANVLMTLDKKGAFNAATGGMVEDVDTIISNVPTLEKKRLAGAAQQIIDKAQEIRITTELGTDLRVVRGDPKTFPSYTTHLYGQVAFAQPEEGVEGTIAFTGVVRIQAPRPETFPVHSPVMMSLKNGRITNIDCKTAEGRYLHNWFHSFGREDAFSFAHINLGLVPLSLRHIDNEAIHFAYGGILMGYGIRGTPLFNTPLGDQTNHIDMHLSKVNYFADDLQILRDGEFTPESGLSLEQS